ncbi:MAG TPA: 2'-5' RNA ligase family protein [Dehalococcoidales bacterium]|nr:2'-5' RNA ligase family protein [Dehalococcoidales bacterium]
MPSTIKTYAVVITFPENIDTLINKLLANYEEYMRHDIVPHMTLIYPFTPVFSLYRLYEALEKVAKATPPIEITLNRIKYFEGENNVAYAALEHRQTVKKLHIDLMKALEGLIKERAIDSRFILERFMPHVTLASRIPDDIFPELQLKLSRFHLHYTNQITEFSLFSEVEGAWQRKRAFELTGK